MAKIIEPNYFLLKCKYIVPNFTNEEWLIEILNGSLFFSQKHPFTERFIVPEKQDHSEPDAVTSTYSIDFKLLVNQAFMAAKNKNKPDIDYSHMKQGFITVKTHEPVAPMPTSNFLSDISQITEEGIRRNSFQNDSIASLIKNFEKEKNLFLYFPYEYQDLPKVPDSVYADMLTKIFSVVLSYRSKACPCWDTFICIKIDTDFLIFEWDGSVLLYRDKVSEYLCCNYLDAKKYSLY